MKRTVMRIKKTIYAFLGILIVVILLFTIPPKNAVRATMLIHGASPVSALRCNPKYDSGNSRELKMALYTIPNKYGYIDNTGVRNTLFRVKTYFVIFHVAVPGVQYLS